MQSKSETKHHVAIIMDGNGRWATARGLPRHAGHEAGAEAVRRVAEAAPQQGIGTLTLFAFSGDNWRRPETEVGALMGLFRAFLRAELGRLAELGCRLSVIGRRDRLPDGFAAEIARVEANTSRGGQLHLRLAIDYSGRDAILRAAALAGGGERVDREAFARFLTGEAGLGEVDLLIRTGGERRLSDFLLWESAYAELYFTPRMWPDFDASDLAEAVADFRRRDRRFGGVGAPASAA
jgi:undecaprenyl diphosphate synthase